MAGRIVGTGCYLPPSKLDNRAIADFISTSPEWVVQKTGIEERRVIDEADTVSDMASRAAQDALDSSGVPLRDVGAIVVSTSTAETRIPSVASVVFRNLGGVDGCITLDVNAVCSGWVHAVEVGLAFARGCDRLALVIGSDAYTRIIDWTDRNTCILFGDGAGALLLAPDGGRVVSCLDTTSTAGECICTRKDRTGSGVFAMEGRVVKQFAIGAFVDAVRRLLGKIGRSVDDVTAIVPHQANQRILEAAVAELGVAPEKVVSNVRHYGNTASASVPIALHEYLRRVSTSVPITLPTNYLIVTVSFGGGLAWGANAFFN